jgi:hypothetical protein
MRKWSKYHIGFVCMLGLGVIQSPAPAETIISATGTAGVGALTIGGPVSPPSYLATSWIQTGTTNGVKISFEAFQFFTSDATGTAFLTTQIGPGTTSAHQVASAPFTIPGAPPPVTSAIKQQLFSGLTLSPGTYYLTLAAPISSSWPVWKGTLPGSTAVITAAGVTLGAQYQAGPALGTPTDPTYPPASTFGPLGFDLNFEVTGALEGIRLICRPVDPQHGIFGAQAPLIARHCYFLAMDASGQSSTYGAYSIQGKLTPQKNGDLVNGQPEIPGGCNGGPGLPLSSECIEIPILKTQSVASIVLGLENAVAAGPQGRYDNTTNNSNRWVQSQIDVQHLAVTLPTDVVASEADLCRLLGYLEDVLRTNGVRFWRQLILFYFGGLFPCAF